MKPAKLPIDSIVVGERMRKDLGDVSELARSISELGLIHPIVIDEKRNLLAGGRRYHACREILKWTDIDVVLHETAGSQALLRRIELEENIKRKDMNWKEKTRLIAEYHKDMLREKGLSGDAWSMRETGKLLGVSAGNVSYCVTVTRLLEDDKHPIQHAESLMDALRIIAREKEDEVNRLLVAGSAKPGAVPVVVQAPVVPQTIRTSAGPTVDDVLAEFEQAVPEEPPVVHTKCVACEGTGKSSSGEVCRICKGQAPQAFVGDEIELPLSKMFYNMDARAFLTESPPDMFDHIVTDPPYGIDMDYINQGDKNRITDLERTKEQHDVQENLQLIHDFMPLLYKVLKPGGYCVLWYDNVHWQYLVDLAERVGFAVQRWPLIWCKTDQCLNQCANTNWTKASEFAIVLRKGVATLRNTQNKNYILASGVDKKQFSHPFAKPPEVWEWILRAIASPGQLVLDPFMGCGSSVWTMAKIGVRPMGVEKMEHWYNECFTNMQRSYEVWMHPRKVKFA